MIKLILKALLILPMFIFIACGDDEDEVFTPKPKGYMRIDFPKKEYKLYDSICPFTFEIPVYSHVEKDQTSQAEPCWLNVNYPQFKAKLHLSYAELTNNLRNYIETSRELAYKHQVKASGLEQQVVIRDSAKVYGLVYDIAGNTASSIQFYVTDSTHHFMRGSLYFNVPPNIDSLQIVVDFLKKDIHHMIQTVKWK